MHRKRNGTVIIFIGVILFAAAGLWAAGAPEANAQCGSQASSCKNCHEVQGQDPVNTDGTPWHTSHAFGDFCYICHAGNNQATGEAEAHAGMVPPLSDIKASCQQCHPNDMQELAQVYASQLGVEIGAGGAAAPPSSPNEPPAPAGEPVQVSALAPTELDIDDPNLVDYSKNYNEIVLGKKPINWGNLILLALIALVMVVGGGFVLSREKVIKVTFGDLKSVDPQYHADVIEMLPAIARLKPANRRSLKNFLDRPGKSEKILDLMEAVASEEITEE